MSNLPMTWLIPACLLSYYLPVLALARFWPAATPGLLKRIHLGGWAFTLLLLIAFAGLRISLRGQWLDAVPFGAAWLAAGSYFLLERKHLSWASKLYFGSWFFYPAALVGAYLLDRLFFVLVAAPIYPLLPTTEFYNGPECSLRAPVSGPLGPPLVELILPYGLVLERHKGRVGKDVMDFVDDNPLSNAKVLSISKADTVSVMVTTASGRQMIHFAN